MYKTPADLFLRLHFSRSRFTRTLEDTLLILANKIANLGMVEKSEFNLLIDKAIRETVPGSLSEKAISNRRSEMISLFGLVKYEDNFVLPGKRLSTLMQSEDIPRFFKSFCNRFQFPGGFLKPDKISDMVLAGVKFKPAQYILKMLKIAQSKHGDFALSAAEVTHFIFYDKRVTVQGDTPDKALERIIEARRNEEQLDKTGDLIRYARDFLNYMVEANLLAELKGMYAINDKEADAIKVIVADKNFFDGYSKVIKSDGTWDKEEYKKVDAEWMEWFADGPEDVIFQTSAQALIKDDSNYPDQWKKIKEILERKDPVLRGNALKEIGDEGEKIVYEYEKEEVRRTRKDLVQLVRLVSSTAALGYDIISVNPEDGRKKKYIEVKTTKKNYVSNINIPFTISINEWSVAKQLGDDYYIYRVIITKEGLTIFSVQNPFKQAEEGNLLVEPIAYKVVYSEKSGTILEI